MAKIALIRPSLTMPKKTVSTFQATPHIGIAYLSASLKSAGHTVIVIDALGEAIHKFSHLKDSHLLINGLTAEEIGDRIPSDVDVIGLTCMFSNAWNYIRTVLDTINNKFANIPVILGGEHITADPEYSLRTGKGVTACALGEGEQTIVDLVDAILGKRSLHDIKGIAFLDQSGSFYQTERRSRILSVDDIPWPDWENYPLEEYLKEGLGFNTAIGRPIPMMASRGCPYQCTFCSSPNMWTTKWIARDPMDVIKEIKFYIEKYNIDHVEFFDLTAIIEINWIIDFTKALIKEDIDISWSLPSGTRTEILDEEILALIKKSGCHKLTYAPEAGSATTLKRIKKIVKLDRMIKSIRAAQKVGIRVKSNLMFGIPGQTKYECLETFGFLSRTAWSGMWDVSLFNFVPYPGSELFSQLMDEKKIDQNDHDAYDNFLMSNIYGDAASFKSWSKYITDRQLSIIIFFSFFWFYGLSFLFRPQRLVYTIWRQLRNKPTTTLDLLIRSRVRNIFRRIEKKPTPAKITTWKKDKVKELKPKPVEKTEIEHKVMRGGIGQGKI